MMKAVDGKMLRCGITTGSCAAAAARAAAELLLNGKSPESIELMTPSGQALRIEIENIALESDGAFCSVIKDAGDDPDITDGLSVCAFVSKTASGIEIDGGRGVGRVTKPGLDQEPGQAAINSTPRKMIEAELRKAIESSGYTGGLKAVISIPGGEAIAAKTFNPKLGIIGGLSILGTSGVVEPMSDKALVDTIKAELSVLREEGVRDLLLTIGNYGEDFSSKELKLSGTNRIKCSNFIGDALENAWSMDFDRILIVGHIGKLVKLGIGITNTHSSFGGGRMETLLSCALRAGGDLELMQKIDASVTTDSALKHLEEAGLLEKTMEILGERITETLQSKTPQGSTIAFICFTKAKNLSGVLCKSGNADSLLEIWR